MVLDVNNNGIPDFLEQRNQNGGIVANTPSLQPVYAPIFLPDETAPNQKSWSPEQAADWFQFVAPKGKKGGPKNNYYNDVIGLMDKLGIPKDKRLDAWKDAITWTQTPGSGAQGDPMDYFYGMIDTSKYADTGKQYGKTKSRTKTVTEYSTSQAANQLTSAYKAELGFEPGAADITAYQAAVNKMAKGEPSIYESTTTTAPGKGGVLSTSKTSGVTKEGFDPTRFAIEYARSNPQYAENFAVRNFMKLIDQALTDPNRIGQVVQ